MNIFASGSCIGVVVGLAVVVPVSYSKFGVWGAVVGVPASVVLGAVGVPLLIFMAFLICILFEEGPKGLKEFLYPKKGDGDDSGLPDTAEIGVDDESEDTSA